MRKVPCPSPGEILIEEFLKPMGITQFGIALSGASPSIGQ